MTKALITGVAGFIGSTLAERLVRAGEDVVGIDCFTDYYPRPAKERNLAWLRTAPNFRFVEARLQDADLRTLLAAAGVPILDIARLLGHSNVAVTMRYAHFQPQAGRAAVDKLEAALGFAPLAEKNTGQA